MYSIVCVSKFIRKTPVFKQQGKKYADYVSMTTIIMPTCEF